MNYYFKINIINKKIVLKSKRFVGCVIYYDIMLSILLFYLFLNFYHYIYIEMFELLGG